MRFFKLFMVIMMIWGMIILIFDLSSNLWAIIMGATFLVSLILQVLQWPNNNP